MTEPSSPLSFDEWIARDAIPFDPGAPNSFNNAVDRLMTTIGDSVELLGLGEPLHGGEQFLTLRNCLFQRLVEAQGFTAIALESSFPHGFAVNDYICGRSNAATAYADVEDAGFSHGFGKLDTTRELIEWMHDVNARRPPGTKLHFYGFDSPTEMMYSDSPRRLLEFALDYLTSIDAADAHERRERIAQLLGSDADWENPAANMDATKSIGLTPAATTLRIETEDLITEFHIRRPELANSSGNDRYSVALRHAKLARQLLTYHAAVAGDSPNRLPELLGMRDVMMADNLAWIVEHERPRGRVLAFAHNSHLKCGRAEWQLGPQLLAWWPAGAQLRQTFGPRYTVIGAALGTSEENGIAPPEPGTLEARLAGFTEPANFIPTHRGVHLSPSDLSALPTRTASTKNPSYFPLTAQSLRDFDYLLTLRHATYTRGGPPLVAAQSSENA